MKNTVFLVAVSLFAQNNLVTVAPPARVAAAPGDAVKAALKVKIGSGLHANSNAPADPFLIPMRLTWNAGPLESISVVFPKPEIRSLGFSNKPVSVFTDEISILSNFKIASSAPPGSVSVTGKLHYQACDEKSCFPPATIEVTLPVEITRKAQ
jgi:thiol:disulfide interchange protein DsbD